MLKQVAAGAVATVVAFALGWGMVVACGVALAALSGCGSPALLQCRVEAVKMLPDDPMQLTFGDVADLTQRLHACKAQAPDAGR